MSRDKGIQEERENRMQDLRNSINNAKKELRAINRQARNESIASCISSRDKGIQEEIVLILLNSTREGVIQHILDVYLSA